MKKIHKTKRASIVKKYPIILEIHKWIIFGVACIIAGFFLATSMQTGLAKGKPIPTPTPTAAPTPTGTLSECQLHPQDPSCCGGIKCNN